MKKLAIVLDLHVGNYGLLTAAISSINVNFNQEDKIHILYTSENKNIYQNQQYKNFINENKTKIILSQINSSNNFSDQLKNIVQSQKQSQIVIFKTTLPIAYYDKINKTLQSLDKKTIKDNWYIMPSIDSVIVPDRKGQVIKINENNYVSAKSQQYVQNVGREIRTVQPDYFIFGKEFLEILFMVNEIKERNINRVIQCAMMLKKPVVLQGKPLIKKYWQHIPNDNKYSLIPQYMMPVVDNRNGKNVILTMPTIVGNKYFKNSSWFIPIIGTIDVIQYNNKKGKQLLEKVSIKYDQDVNSRLYITKFIKWYLSFACPTRKFDFYTRNPSIKSIYEKVLDSDILQKINWVNMDNNFYYYPSNFLDYIQNDSFFKIDFNFFMTHSQDPQQAIERMFSFEENRIQFNNLNTGKQIQSELKDQFVRLLPLSKVFLTKERVLSSLSKTQFKKGQLYIQPFNVKANSQQQFVHKSNAQFNDCIQGINLALQGKKIEADLFVNTSQDELIDRIFTAAKKYQNIYVMNKNLLYTIGKLLNRNIIIRGGR